MTSPSPCKTKPTPRGAHAKMPAHTTHCVHCRAEITVYRVFLPVHAVRPCGRCVRDLAHHQMWGNWPPDSPFGPHIKGRMIQTIHRPTQEDTTHGR